MSIQNYLNQIKNAIFGREVRQSIHDAIKQCYDDASINHDNANMEVKLARGTHETLNNRLDENDKKQESFSTQLVEMEQKKADELDLQVLSERMNNFTSLQGGSTSGDAELIDGRIDDLGVSHTNIGAAFRTRVSKLSNEISDIKIDLFPIDKTLWENGTINSDGTVSASEWGLRTKSYISSFKKLGVYSVKLDSKYKLKIIMINNENSISYYDTNWRTKNFYITINKYVSGIKFLISKTNGEKITVNDLQHISLSVFYDYELNKNEDFNEWEYGTLLSSDGSKTPSNIRMVTAFKEVKNNKIYEIELNKTYDASIIFYDKDYKKVYYSDYGTKNVGVGHSPKYYRAVIKNINDETILNPCEFGLKLKEVKNNYISRGDIIKDCVWEQGTLNNGEEVSSTIRLRTKPYKMNSSCFYRVSFSKTDYSISAELYDNNLKHLQSIEYHTKQFNINGFDGKIRFLIKNSTGADRTMKPDEILSCGISIFEDTDDNMNSNSYEKIKVGTFNIGKFGYGVSGGYNKEDIDEAILNWNKTLSKCELDILGVQEFYNYFDVGNKRKSRKEIFNNIFSTTKTGLLEQAICSNFDLYNINCGMLDYSNPMKRPYLKGYFKVNNRDIAFIVCHLNPDDEDARSRERRELIDLLKNEKAFILTGDFNAINILEYVDYKTAGFNLANGGAFGIFNTYIHQDYPLDNIITSPNIKIGNVEKLKDGLTSDHNMLIADLLIAID